MLVRQQALDPGFGQQGGEKALRHVGAQQPVPVLGENARIPHRIVDSKPHEPAEQKIELQPLHQLTLRANRIEQLQQAGPQQLLRRNRGPALPRIQAGKHPI